MHSKGKEQVVKRFVSKEHLRKYHWLVLSDYKQGLLCKYCVLFAGTLAGHNKGAKLKNLVTTPLIVFKDLTGKDGFLETHDRSLYHRNSVEAGKNFLKCYNKPQQEVINILSSQRLKQIQENRARLIPIIESIIFLGRQNIPLRGHRDDGQNLEISMHNEGNFRALLNFRIQSGDKQLETHLNTASSRATYISKTTQNTLINCCGEEITNIIIENIQKARYYSILFDETTDQAHIEQMVLVIRYLDGNVIKEQFLRFIDAYRYVANLDSENSKNDSEAASERASVEHKLTGKMLAKIVCEYLTNLGLDLQYCVGIGTDGCSVMTSDAKGAVSELLKSAVNAKHVSCYNHVLNNSIAQSSKVQSVRNITGVIKEVLAFFNQSSKRNFVIKSLMGRQLISLCETRWVERHDSFILFDESLPHIIKSLAEISGWSDNNSSKKATIFISTLCSTEFVTALKSTIDILKITLPLSRFLQTVSLDLNRASEAVTNTISLLKERRNDCDKYFSDIYKHVEATALELEFDLRMPRLTSRQTHRDNYEGSSIQIYYQRCLYIPLLDHIINDLESRFSNHTLECYDLRFILPAVIIKDEEYMTRIKRVAERYHNILPNNLSGSIDGELALWRQKWQKVEENDLPRDVFEVFLICDGELFHTIKEILKILLTLPVSTASAERSFSTLNRAKTWLRSRMGDERLNGLCLLYIHREIIVDVKKIIERFAKGGEHRLEFVV